MLGMLLCTQQWSILAQHQILPDGLPFIHLGRAAEVQGLTEPTSWGWPAILLLAHFSL